MPEAITKYAVNSTLGTAGFKPLDKIIQGQRTYAPSDSVLTVLASNLNISTISTVEKQIPNVKFKSLVNGSIRVAAICVPVTSPGAPGSLILSVYENGTKIYDNSSSEKSNTYTAIDFPISKYKEYTFTIKSTDNGRGGALQSMNLCGHIVDLSMLEIGGDE